MDNFVNLKGGCNQLMRPHRALKELSRRSHQWWHCCSKEYYHAGCRTEKCFVWGAFLRRLPPLKSLGVRMNASCPGAAIPLRGGRYGWAQRFSSKHKSLLQAGQKVPAIKEIIVVLHVAHLCPFIKVCQPSNMFNHKGKNKGICWVANAEQKLSKEKNCSSLDSEKNTGNMTLQTKQNHLSIQYFMHVYMYKKAVCLWNHSPMLWNSCLLQVSRKNVTF